MKSAAEEEDLLLMRSYWQLADMCLCIARVPTMLKVCWQPLAVVCVSHSTASYE